MNKPIQAAGEHGRHPQQGRPKEQKKLGEVTKTKGYKVATSRDIYVPSEDASLPLTN